ncbi:uncharacterized protein N7484_007926 [Penicillium longicatenatum]|uniref:uncharacterized protein n=1 Tax=Penicillium longicatenatum TaxID=1561947 RepID=UPI002548117E|nr:uncharacterized protein N7484_007926 [Penicillium longicatenatum]KAJ5640064.1 hypothetical protein N7484_007926 [Penicillium longicatenatum]
MTGETFWEEHSTFATNLSQGLSSSLIDRSNSEEAHIKMYFEHFHPSLPLLHRPTFTVSSAPKLLLNAVTAIGSLFSASSYDLEEAQACANWRRGVWQSGQQDLRNMVYDMVLLTACCFG